MLMKFFNHAFDFGWDCNFSLHINTVVSELVMRIDIVYQLHGVI